MLTVVLGDVVVYAVLLGLGDHPAPADSRVRLERLHEVHRPLRVRRREVDRLHLKTHKINRSHFTARRETMSMLHL